MLAPPKRIVVFDTIYINCEVTSRLLSISTRYSRRPGSLRADAFRGHGFSLLALSQGMSTLFAKNGVSRHSLGEPSGSSGTCYSRRTRKASAALHRTKKIALYFRGVTALHLPGLVKLFTEKLCY